MSEYGLQQCGHSSCKPANLRGAINMGIEGVPTPTVFPPLCSGTCMYNLVFNLLNIT